MYDGLLFLPRTAKCHEEKKKITRIPRPRDTVHRIEYRRVLGTSKRRFVVAYERNGLTVTIFAVNQISPIIIAHRVLKMQISRPRRYFIRNVFGTSRTVGDLKCSKRPCGYEDGKTQDDNSHTSPLPPSFRLFVNVVLRGLTSNVSHRIESGHFESFRRPKLNSYLT